MIFPSRCEGGHLDATNLDTVSNQIKKGKKWGYSLDFSGKRCYVTLPARFGKTVQLF